MSIHVVCISSDADERSRFMRTQQSLTSEVQWRVHGQMDDFLGDLEQIMPGETLLVVIGSRIEEIAQLNLVDAVRTSFSQATIIVVLPARDEETINRAMLAGASAALAIDWEERDLASVLKRISKALKGTRRAGESAPHSLRGNNKNNILSFVGAKGGVGKSTICALLAHRFAKAGLRVAIVDFDLQFGDMRFLFKAQPSKTLNDLLAEINSAKLEVVDFGCLVSDQITLFSPEFAPEKAELFNGKPAQLLNLISNNYDLVLVNTGAFWTLFHIELLEASSQVVCLTEPGIVATRATQALMSLCTKLNLSTAQFNYVVNKLTPYGLSAHDICDAIGVLETFGVNNFAQEFSLHMDAGNIERAYEFVEAEGALEKLALSLSQKLGVTLRGASAVQVAMKKSPWWRSK